MIPQPINGRLEDRALPVLLVELASRSATGVLRIDARAGRHEIWLREGQAVGVVLPGAAEMIGKVLVEMGLLDEAVHRQSLASPPPNGMRYGDMLLDQKLVTPEQMRLALKAQVRRKLHRLFFLPDGTFSFEEQAHTQGIFQGESLKVQTARAVYQGVRSAWTAERLSSSLFLLTAQAFRCKLSSDELVRYGLGAHDAQIGELLRQGFYTIDSLTQATKAPQQPLYSLIYALYVTNGLEIKPAASVKVESAPIQFQPTPPPGRDRVATPGSMPGRSTSGTMPAVPGRSISGSMPAVPGRSISGQMPAVRQPLTTPLPGITGARPIFTTPTAAAGTDSLRQQIADKARVVEKEDLFAVLGLPDMATIADVKNAYFELAKRFHPDRIASQGLESQRAEVELIFRRINEAYTTLSDDQKRAVFLKERKEGVHSVEDRAKALRIVEADMAFRRGEVFLKKNDLQNALRELTEAHDKNPQEGEILAYLTWTKVCLNQMKHAEAKPIFSQAVKLSPKCGRAYYYLGICYKEEGDLDRALSSFQKAIQYDQRLIEAEREARLINMRKNEKPKGFFDKLRGR